MNLSQTLTLNQYCTVINKASLDQLLIVIRSLVIASAITCNQTKKTDRDHQAYS